MKLLVAGGTGFIGTPLCYTLVAHGHEVRLLSRRPQPASSGIRVLSWEDLGRGQGLTGVEGVVNLAGEPIVGRRWSPAQKARVTASRVETTRRLVAALVPLSPRPSVLVNASAVGYYGAREDEPLTETDAPGRGFLAELCQAWETEARAAESIGIRTVRLRLGVVLGPGGGALAKMVPPFRMFVGGPLGDGRQILSWVHLDDVIGLIEWALESALVSGAVNATAPEPVTMREFSRELGRVLHRPSWAPVPAGVLRLLMGEMAEMLLTGQRVLPRVALSAGYRFRHPDLSGALRASLLSS